MSAPRAPGSFPTAVTFPSRRARAIPPRAAHLPGHLRTVKISSAMARMVELGHDDVEVDEIVGIEEMSLAWMRQRRALCSCTTQKSEVHAVYIWCFGRGWLAFDGADEVMELRAKRGRLASSGRDPCTLLATGVVDVAPCHHARWTASSPQRPSLTAASCSCTAIKCSA